MGAVGLVPTDEGARDFVSCVRVDPRRLAEFDRLMVEGIDALIERVKQENDRK
jgi:hypothetical protein